MQAQIAKLKSGWDEWGLCQFEHTYIATETIKKKVADNFILKATSNNL